MRRELNTEITVLLFRDAGEGAREGASALLPFLKGRRGSEVPFLNCFYSDISHLGVATVFQPENTTEGTLCLKLTEIHLITLLSCQYKASTWQYKQYMIGKDDNKYLLNVVFSSLSFLLPPSPCYCSGVPAIITTTMYTKYRPCRHGLFVGNF